MDNRQFQRINFREAVQYHKADWEEKAGSLGLDLSKGGLQCTIQEFLPLGSKILLDFSLPQTGLVQIEAKVVWIQRRPYMDSFQVGLEFDPTVSFFNSRERIQQYVDGQALNTSI